MVIMISVVICTYNRCDLLKQVMQTLVNQKLSSKLYEIIVVDNNSKDNTKDIVNQIISNNLDKSIYYVLETKQGLSHARNRGWKEAKGEYVAYIDDDCKAPEQWLEIAKQIIDQHSPAIFGGPYYAFYSSPKPNWFKDSYGSHTLGDQAHPMGFDEFVSGGNIFFRKSLLQKIGGFDPKLGMVGNKIAYGEETVLQIYVRESMPTESIYYDPDLYMYHLVRPEKMSLKWNLRKRIADGCNSYQLFHSRKIKLRPKLRIGFNVIIYLFLIFVDLFRIFFRDKKRYPYFENYAYERIFGYVEALTDSFKQLKT